MTTFSPVPDDIFFTTFDGRRQQGLTQEIFASADFTGEPVSRTVISKAAATFTGTPEGITGDQYSVRWTGELVVPETGEYSIRGGTRITIDGEPIGGGGGGMDSEDSAAPRQRNISLFSPVRAMHSSFRELHGAAH